MSTGALDPRTPVLVGAGQWVNRPDRSGGHEMSPEPVDVMAETLRRAEEDAGVDAGSLVTKADSVQVVQLLSWRYGDPAALVAERLGATPRDTVYSAVGGNTPQMLANQAALAIQRGEMDVALITGCEVMYTRFQARKRDIHLDWNRDDTATPSRVVGDDRLPSTSGEMTRGLLMPTQVYPAFETAIRAATGRSVAEHRRVVSDLWARFSGVAATNPYAWSPEAVDATTVDTPTPDNRMVAFPYTKLLCANLQTDQGAGLILCSAAAADAAGVPRDRWVFPLAGADSHDHWFMSERADLCSSPAVAANGRAALGLAGTGIDEIGVIDVYSCFPSAVQIGAAALGLPLDDPKRPLTVTGGLTFGGGPGNAYVLHSIASMVDALRAGDRGATGLVTALGWYVTKHSLGIYGTDPPATGGFRWRDCQPEVDATPTRAYVEAFDGPVTIEASTVLHERDGAPEKAIVACLTADGQRTWANSTDAAFLELLETEETAGRAARVTPDGTIHLEG